MVAVIVDGGGESTLSPLVVGSSGRRRCGTTRWTVGVPRQELGGGDVGMDNMVSHNGSCRVDSPLNRMATGQMEG